MKRLLTNLLVVALFWPGLAVAVVAVTGPDMPACCRRDGPHCHADHSKEIGFQAVSPPCPFTHQSLPVSTAISPSAFSRTTPVRVSARLLTARRVIRLRSRAFAQLPVRAPPDSASL